MHFPESLEGQGTIFSTSSHVRGDGQTEENPIRLVTDAVPEAQKGGQDLKKHESSEEIGTKTAQTDASKEISRAFVDRLNNSLLKVVSCML